MRREQKKYLKLWIHTDDKGGCVSKRGVFWIYIEDILTPYSKRG